MTLKDHALSIQERHNKERKDGVRNPAIAGAYASVMGQPEKRFWITNFDSQRSSSNLTNIYGEVIGTSESHSVHTLQEYGKSITICKNRPIARLLLNNFGYAKFPNGDPIDISASYSWGASLDNPIKIGTKERSNWEYMLLADMLKLEDDDVSEEEKIVILKRLESLRSSSGEARHFIREQAELRKNPLLDDAQNDAKFSHIFDGITEIIDGGPGTGKTTTLIQRLKYLISPDEINENFESEGKRKLTTTQIQIIGEERKNWLFFSPTPQLCRYLRSNMEYEGLNHVSEHTVVWTKHLNKILRDEYDIAGEDKPFSFRERDFIDKKIFKKKNLNIVKRFEGFYLKSILKKLQKVANVDYNEFSWKMIGKYIVDYCKEAENIHNLKDLVSCLIKLENLKEQSLPNGHLNILEVEEHFKKRSSDIALKLQAKIRRKDALYNQLLELVEKWKTVEVEDEVEDESQNEENNSNQSNEVILDQRIKNLLIAVAMRKYDKKSSLKGKRKELFEAIKDLIDFDEIESMAEFAYFHRIFMPVVRNMETMLFSQITSSYKAFRKNEYKQKKERDWHLKTLKIIIDKENRLIHQQERALLLGFINKLIIQIRKVSVGRYEKMTHKFVVAYRNCYCPIIGVDEATDYTLYDYYAISSLRHPVISSMTLVGDLMQGLNEYGISEWSQIKNAVISPKIDVKDLNISYRQSPKLLELAEYIYEKSRRTKPPYYSPLKDTKNMPSPLWYSNDDNEDKAQWIVKRILEIKKAYSMVPSIAIFVSSKEEAEILKQNMDETEDLDEAGIEVKNCSDDLADATKDTVRIFPIDMVKGMEFEAVFFHDIQNIKNTNLIDRYLYIGLSRASFYMAVTSSEDLDSKIEDIKNLFSLNGNWK